MNRMRIKWNAKNISGAESYLFILLLMTLIILGAALSASGNTIYLELLSDRKIPSDHILLSHIAKIKSTDEGFIETLRTIAIAKAPRPGQQRLVRKSHILRKLKEKGVPASSVSIKGPETITVQRGSMRISSKKIRGVVTRTLKRKMPWDPKNVRFVAKGPEKSVLLPEGRLNIRATPLEKEDYIGTVPVLVSFYVSGQLKKKIWVTTGVTVYKDVLVAKKPIGRYQLITEKEVGFKKVKMTESSRGFFTHLEEVLGKRAKRVIPPKTVLVQSAIEMPPTVKRGDRVIIIAESGFVKVTTKGITKEKGYEGDRIRVMNLDSKKMILARIVSSGVVQVEY